MKWLEIIELRSVEKDKKSLEHRIEYILQEMKKECRCGDIRAYRCAMIETDFSIHICHTAEEVETGGSQAGLCLVAALREFGLVNHSIWTETFD
jgi:hypothetical protein